MCRPHCRGGARPTPRPPTTTPSKTTTRFAYCLSCQDHLMDRIDFTQTKLLKRPSWLYSTLFLRPLSGRSRRPSISNGRRRGSKMRMERRRHQSPSWWYGIRGRKRKRDILKGRSCSCSTMSSTLVSSNNGGPRCI